MSLFLQTKYAQHRFYSRQLRISISQFISGKPCIKFIVIHMCQISLIMYIFPEMNPLFARTAFLTISFVAFVYSIVKFHVTNALFTIERAWESTPRR
jgi:hypothetical protein